MNRKIAVTFLLFVQVLCLFSFTRAQERDSTPDSYLNLRFWDDEVDKCFLVQETSNSCVSSSIQIVLKYLDFSPLPNQTQLANEMNTDINSTTKWRFTYIPFNNRGYFEYYNQSLSDDFGKALEYLKGNVSQNHPAILRTWYNETWKAENNITHARVVTGYNSTGIFLHDPSDGPNRYMNYSTLSSLWNDSGYWAFIVKEEPKFDLIVNVKDWLGNPIPDVKFTLRGAINRTDATDISGTVKFSNLTIEKIVLKYDWRCQSEENNITLTRTIIIDYNIILSDQTIWGIVIITIFTIAVVTYFYLKKRG